MKKVTRRGAAADEPLAGALQGMRFNGPPMAWHTYSIIVDLERPVEIVALEEALSRPTSD
jgi:hypothetical protein